MCMYINDRVVSETTVQFSQAHLNLLSCALRLQVVAVHRESGSLLPFQVSTDNVYSKCIMTY
jgi:hypothetical protein